MSTYCEPGEVCITASPRNNTAVHIGRADGKPGETILLAPGESFVFEDPGWPILQNVAERTPLSDRLPVPKGDDGYAVCISGPPGYVPSGYRDPEGRAE